MAAQCDLFQLRKCYVSPLMPFHVSSPLLSLTHSLICSERLPSSSPCWGKPRIIIRTHKDKGDVHLTIKPLFNWWICSLCECTFSLRGCTSLLCVPMDMMALFHELVGTIIILMTKPFSLVKLSCIFAMRSFCIVVYTWVEVLRTSISVHLNILWSLTFLTFALISLPVRVLTALQRERLLQMRLHELQIELENLVWNRKELEERLQMAIKECRMMEAMLTELEDDHDQAIVKIELLESELQDVIEENLRLKEIQGKRLRSFRSQVDAGKGNDCNNEVADMYGSYGMPSWKSSFDGSGVILEDLLIHKDTWEEERKHKADSLDFMRTELKVSGPSNAVPPGIILSGNLDMNEVLGKRREVALSQSFFSAVLSLFVGMIIWEAEDPCMPLVVALFTVVAMSLKSVAQFFCTIKNKPASDAVALLSINWFILGTLAYPMLPKIACMLIPTALSFLEWTASLLGFTF